MGIHTLLHYSASDSAFADYAHYNLLFTLHYMNIHTDGLLRFVGLAADAD